ncbi:hypothetical protein EDB85DRAFT_1885456 [Lactarius pseudohatsudake]|nr:hypothetical protein EDB85DRAFT_1885456 [Lactarius pseudohatsudake]
MAASSIEVDTERHDTSADEAIPHRRFGIYEGEECGHEHWEGWGFRRKERYCASPSESGRIRHLFQGYGIKEGYEEWRGSIMEMVQARGGGRACLSNDLPPKKGTQWSSNRWGRVNNDIILPLRLVWVIPELEMGLKYHQVTAAYSMVKSQSHTSTSPSDAPAPPANAFNAPPPLPSRGGAYSVQHTHIRGRQRSTCREVTRRSGTRAYANDVEHNDKGMIISVNSERARHRTSYRRPEGIVI